MSTSYHNPQWTQPSTSSSSQSSSVEVIPSSNSTGLPTLQIGTVSESDDQHLINLSHMAFFTTGLITLRRRSAIGLANKADAVATVAMVAVVVIVPTDGRY